MALAGACAALGVEGSWDWVATDAIPNEASEMLRPYGGIWCVPGSPYANANGAVAAIHFARVTGRPFLGTCGGFQHALLEYAANVWNVGSPAHAETDPDASDPVIAPLECALVEVSDMLDLVPGSRLRRIYGRDRIREQYHCAYGLSPRYAARLDTGPMRVAARNPVGDVRAVELDDHVFFIAALFQPERRALQGHVPELARAFVHHVTQAA
jgi:CTP synthase (UTP-ammonia lyase)